MLVERDDHSEATIHDIVEDGIVHGCVQRRGDGPWAVYDQVGNLAGEVLAPEDGAALLAWWLGQLGELAATPEVANGDPVFLAGLHRLDGRPVHPEHFAPGRH